MAPSIATALKLALPLCGCHLSHETRFIGYTSMLDRPTLDPALLARFAAIVGDKYAITDPDMQAPYLVEMRNMFQGHTPVVLRPGAVDEVSKIVALANETATAIVPQGQYRPGRRPDPAAQRDRPFAQPARPHPRDRSDLQHHHL